MSRASEPITVALLALPATTAATLYGFFDALASGLARELHDLASPPR